MAFPILAPRLGELIPAAPLRPQPAVLYKEAQWDAMYPQIERLYIHERRKLRYVMQYMDREYGFKATEQMYKKRFSKWGFKKYPDAKLRSLRGKPRRRDTHQTVATQSISALPSRSFKENLEFMLLFNVETWSSSFFEAVRRGDHLLAFQQEQLSTDQPRFVKTIEISFAFKLVSDLLEKGRGGMAGRMARKAFLLLEDMLTLEAPALIWNLLEMTWNMVTLGHIQLFQILLNHLASLVQEKLPRGHPLSTILQSILGLVRKSVTQGSNVNSPASTSSSDTPSVNNDQTGSTVNASLLSGFLTPLLEQAWICNARNIFNHFDPALIQLYCDIFWDTCTINLPMSMVDTAAQWLNQIKAQDTSIVETEYQNNLPSKIDSTEEQRMLHRLLVPRSDASPPQNYYMLRTSSLEALRERGKLIFSQGAKFEGDTPTLLRMLAGLITAKILEGWREVVDRSTTPRGRMKSVPRIYAGNLACAIRALLDLETASGDSSKASSGTVDRIRSIVALSEYAQGETDPQVVQEMWLLEDALLAAGRFEEAREVSLDAYKRLETYVQDVPVASV